jgi:formate dehydrogenase iron-sulfur subunit
MSLRLYVPGDMAAVAVGADEVAGALAIEAAKQSLPIEIVRNGSRGMFELETLVEVETPAGRIGYGPVYAEEVPA